jgi:hypothetical protein
MGSIHMRQSELPGHSWMVSSKILRRCLLVQRTMGSDRVVHRFPLGQGSVDAGHVQWAAVGLVELLGVGAVRPLHPTVQLGRMRR